MIKVETDLLRFRCSGIVDGGSFSLEHTGRGRDISPAFLLDNLSPEAKTLAITLEDLSHPIKNFTHWIIWNIPAAKEISPAIPAGKTVPSLGGAVQGLGYGLHCYAGPKPPKGRTHIYRFTIYALDCWIHLGSAAVKGSFLRKAKGHILQKGCITGSFE
jgi:hypothetical protein